MKMSPETRKMVKSLSKLVGKALEGRVFDPSHRYISLQDVFQGSTVVKDPLACALCSMPRKHSLHV